MTALLLLALLSVSGDDGFIVFAPKGDGTVHLDEPGNLLEVTEVKRGEPAPADGFWVPPEVLASLTETRAEWREEAKSYREKTWFGRLVMLLAGLVLGMLLKQAPSGKSRQLSPPR